MKNEETLKDLAAKKIYSTGKNKTDRYDDEQNWNDQLLITMKIRIMNE